VNWNEYDFDPSKDELNYKLHKLHFTTAQLFLEHDNNPDIEYEHRNNEDRYRGTFRRNDHYLFVVYTMRGDVIRLISARPATKGVIRHYYERR